jgi:hypothetical protein
LSRKFFLIFLITVWFNPELSVNAAKNSETISALLTVKVAASIEPSGEQGAAINNARLIVINSFGEIIATAITNSTGEAKINVTVPKDPRFPLVKMGEVSVIAVANGYNEHINFSVPINEFDDHEGRVHISLWAIDPKRRNEPTFLNGSFHRFTVFEMLDFYAQKIGLKRQEISGDLGEEPPWGPELNAESKIYYKALLINELMQVNKLVAIL